MHSFPSSPLLHPLSLSPAPPVIIYTTEFVIRSQSDFGQTGQLTCTVQTSPDTGSTVAWWINGTKIDTEHSTKYRTEVVPMNPDDVMQHKLTIEDVQHSDIGSYLCPLSTSYWVEDSQEAWLQVDFRKGSCFKLRKGLFDWRKFLLLCRFPRMGKHSRKGRVRTQLLEG